MKKKTLIIATLTLSMFLASVKGYSTYAATSIKSQGRIMSDNGTSETADDVIFDAADITGLNTTITSLDERITMLSTTVDKGKDEIINALEKYPDVNLIGEKNGEGSDTNITFTEIADAINNLTDIPADTYFYEDGTEGDAGIKRYKKVNGKYYECDENGKVTTGAKEVNITGKTLYDYAGATTGNISAGSAAFADGALHLGDGSDHAAYYDRGVTAGKNTTDPNSPNYKAGYNAGTAASKVGTATADKVLSGYTFTSAAGVGISGTMVNRGTLNWNPTSGTTQTIQPGYYSGGTLNSSGAYNAGVTAGKNTTDPNSPNYKAGYNAGTATSKVGTATADKVLSGYTFTSAAGVGVSGTMVNRGALNWNPTAGTTKTVQPGYYSGGTLDSSGAYAQGFVDGQRDITENLNITYTYHKHNDADGAEQSDNYVANKSGGCFTTEKRTSSYENCTHICHYWEMINVNYMDTYSCHIHPNGTISNCGYSGGVLTGDYRNGYTHSVLTGGNLLGYTIGCGKTVSTIESAIIKY